jgi:hypothetical protein
MSNNPPAHRLIKLTVSVLLLVFTLTGCVSARYKKVKENPIPPVLLNLTAEQPALIATVGAVVIFRGPGSWKRDAYWDEYCVRLVNRGDVPFVLESVEIVDFNQDRSVPGANPWLLEKQSLSRADELNRSAKDVVIQIGGLYTGATLAVSAAYVGAGMAGIPGAIAGLIVLPAWVTGTVVRNVSGRHAIEDEFQRRRLVLPQTIAPGQILQGSLFFRIAPAPQRLVFHGRASADPCDVTIDLTPLGSLHLRPAQPLKTD